MTIEEPHNIDDLVLPLSRKYVCDTIGIKEIDYIKTYLKYVTRLTDKAIEDKGRLLTDSEHNNIRYHSLIATGRYYSLFYGGKK